MLGYIYRLHFGPLSLKLIAPPEVIDPLVTAVEPFFNIVRERDSDGADLLATICGRMEAYPADLRPGDSGEQILVDTSLYTHLCSTGSRWQEDDKIIIRIQLADTWITINRSTGLVEIWQPDIERLVIEIERTLKSLLTVGSELSGAVQCHSAAATSSDNPDAGAVLLFGDMWQGKTTVLLEVMEGFRVNQLSCDTTVIFRQDGLGDQPVHGWPSPFSVSHGTMSDHSALVEKIPVDRQTLDYDQLWREGKKSVFRSAEIVKYFGSEIQPKARHVASVVLLRFRMDEPVSLRRIADSAEVEQALRTVYLGSRDPIYHNWHRWLIASDDKIEANIVAVAKELYAKASIYELTWGPSVVSLLRRTEPLGSWHRFSLSSGGKAETSSGHGQ